MGNLWQKQTKQAQASVKKQAASSTNSHLDPGAELQEMLGNQALGRLIESQSHQDRSAADSFPNALHRQISTANNSPIQRQHLFRGLSHELMGKGQGNLVQAKLTVNQPGDKYEQEADRVAEQVVKQINAPSDDRLVEAEAIQTEKLMRKSVPSAAEGVAQSDVEASIQTARGQGQSLPKNFQKPLEQAFNADFSPVRIHTDTQADRLNQSLQAKAFTTGKDIFFRQGEYNPSSQQGQELVAHELTHVIQQNSGLRQQSQGEYNPGNRGEQELIADELPHVARQDGSKVQRQDIIQRTTSEEELSPAERRKMLEKHIGAKAQQQQLIAKNKQGQGMAEQLVREGRVDAFGTTDPNKTEQAQISSALMRLVEFTKFDNSASISVLASAEEGGLSDEQKWNVIKVNSEFMQYVEPSMTINKIIPDATVENIVKDLTMSGKYGNSVTGSVAHKINYDEGLTGAQSVSNFGLDYGGYTDVNDKGENVKLGGDYSSYVKKTGTDQSGKDQIEAVENVFYVQLKLEAKELPKVKVPIHESIINFAKQKLAEISQSLGDRSSLEAMANLKGAKDKNEIVEMLNKKLQIINKFLEIAHFTERMAVSKKLSGQKNEDDPLTNLGITKPGARLKNKFGTINQEYHLSERVNLPPGSGLWLKDETGQDKPIGQLIEEEPGKFKWSLSETNVALIKQAIQKNEDFRKS